MLPSSCVVPVPLCRFAVDAEGDPFAIHAERLVRSECKFKKLLPKIRLVPEPVMKDAAKINPQTIKFHCAAMEYLMVTEPGWPCVAVGPGYGIQWQEIALLRGPLTKTSALSVTPYTHTSTDTALFAVEGAEGVDSVRNTPPTDQPANISGIMWGRYISYKRQKNTSFSE